MVSGEVSLLTRPLLLALAVLASGCAGTGGDFLTTKTPYQPRQSTGYEAAPAGYLPVYTQMVARHGTRGMTGMKDDLALLNMCRQAAQEQALTPLGQALRADIGRLIQAQALLGYGIEGIGKPGYANLSQIGIEEHRQLARRLLQRQPSSLTANAGKTIAIEHSGVDRARDSAWFFTQSLREAAPALSPLIEAPRVNRFTLYFHKLNAKTDGVPDAAHPHAATYAQSQAYQQYVASSGLHARLAAIHADPRLHAAARVVLERLFSTAFVDRLGRGELQFSNNGSEEAVSADGKFRNRVEGDGKTVIGSPVEALMALSALYEIAPGLQRELGRDFRAYIPDAQAQLLAWANDAEDFYVKGPGAQEDRPVTFKMAEGLLRDFFDEADGKAHAASFRFAHAETIIPFAALLGAPGPQAPTPAGQPFNYADNAWRGAEIAPYAANVQWDSVRNAEGRVLVKMLYNEKETDFKPACERARFAAGSHFYDLAGLRACYFPH